MVRCGEEADRLVSLVNGALEALPLAFTSGGMLGRIPYVFRSTLPISDLSTVRKGGKLGNRGE